MHASSQTDRPPSRPHVVVLTGAGISAESGLRTFREQDGLWEGYRMDQVATPEAWQHNREWVLRFYNERRRQLAKVQPNAAHRALVDLESLFEVTIITQNVDDLHERAGSTNILHLHGELTKVRSTRDVSLVYDWGYKDLEEGDLCETGSQLRPHIVWFGEHVATIYEALEITRKADYLLIIGTSLLVYPAAHLIHEAPAHAVRAIVNPDLPDGLHANGFEPVAKPAGVGVPEVVQKWMKSHSFV